MYENNKKNKYELVNNMGGDIEGVHFKGLRQCIITPKHNVPLDLKGCICHFVNWETHPFIFKGTM